LFSIQINKIMIVHCQSGYIENRTEIKYTIYKLLNVEKNYYKNFYNSKYRTNLFEQEPIEFSNLKIKIVFEEGRSKTIEYSRIIDNTRLIPDKYFIPKRIIEKALRIMKLNTL